MTRATLRSRLLVSTARMTLRPVAEALSRGPAQVPFARTVVAAAMFLGSPPPYRVRVDSLDSATVRGEWVYPPSAKDSPQVILYVHGSGYAICSARTHRGIAARLARLTRMPTFVVDYRLAPEYRFPAAADDVAAAYEWLLDIGYRRENITVVGDSAGGHLIIDLLAEQVRQGQTPWATTVLLSPLIDLTLRTAREREKHYGPDPLISARAARRLVSHYTTGQPPDLGRLALTIDPCSALPPTLIQVGGAEMLGGDAQLAHEMITDAGGHCELQVWPGQMHVFQALPALIPEATPALRAVADFITTRSTAPTHDGAQQSTHQAATTQGSAKHQGTQPPKELERT